MQVNQGNVILYGTTPTDLTLFGLTSTLTCVPASTLAVAATMTCSGSFTFNQSSFEAGTKNYSAAFVSANLTAAVESNLVSTVPVEAPSVTIAILASTCANPSDAGELPDEYGQLAGSS